MPLQQRELLLRDIAINEANILHWPLDQFCNGSECTSGWAAGTAFTIPGSNFPIVKAGRTRGGEHLAGNKIAKAGVLRIDSAHPSKQAEAFAAPFLCSILKKHSLLQLSAPPSPPSDDYDQGTFSTVIEDRRERPPKQNRTVEEFRHARQHVNMTSMREEGNDEYRCRIFKRPTDLQGAAITAIDQTYQPPEHRDIIHHNFLRYCTRCPAELETKQVGVSFSCHPTWLKRSMPECMTILLGLGMDQGHTAFPPGLAIPLPDDAPCLLLEMHNKAPTLEEPRLDGKQLLRQAGSLWDSSGLRLTFERPRGGNTFSYVQLLELGPRSGRMLTVPPGRPNHKVSNACPGACFARAMQAAKVPEVDIVGVQQHAHSAATAMFGEAINLRTRTSAMFAAVPDYQRYSRREYPIWLREPIRVTGDTNVKVTCVYNTSSRTEQTFLGARVKDEMCFMYAWISPPVADFNQCWHADQDQGQGLNSVRGKLRPRSPRCHAQCGLHGVSDLKMPRRSSRWSSQVPPGGATDLRMAELGDRWPGAPVCEE